MKIPSVTQGTTTPAATVPLPASPPDDAPLPPRPVVELPGEDGETISIVAPPAELLARLQAEAAAPTDGELAQQLAAAQQSIHADSPPAEAMPAAGVPQSFALLDCLALWAVEEPLLPGMVLGRAALDDARRYFGLLLKFF
ncbi:MAG TPA: hypothetical protein VIU62_09820, partial [Chloroflexota bacterium]